MKVRLGIIGVGGMGSQHATRVVEGKIPEMELVSVADISAERRGWAAEKLPGVKIYESGEQLIREDDCDAVLVATPHRFHPELSILALDSGKHVLCEKPIGVDVKTVREVIAAADRHPELTFALMFNQRTNGLYQKVHSMVAGGEIGALKRVNWIVTDWYRPQFYFDSGSWRATWLGEGGGVLLNQCPHNLDLLTWICGMPTKISAFCHEGKWHDIEVEDDVTAYMEFGGERESATGVFVTTTADAPGSNRLEITGTMGKLLAENGKKLTFYRLKEEERSYCATSHIPFEVPAHDVIEVEYPDVNTQHAGVMNAFAAHILHGEPLVADGREGINELTVSCAMYLSSWLGRPVELPIDEDLFLRMLDERRANSRLKETESVTLDTEGSYKA